MTTEIDPKGHLVEHLRNHSVRTDGPFTLRSGETSDWYIDARQTTFDGWGAILVGEAVLAALDSRVTAVGGMTLGADPIAVATAISAARARKPIQSFSIRKESKDHGTSGRLVGRYGGDEFAVSGNAVISFDLGRAVSKRGCYFQHSTSTVCAAGGRKRRARGSPDRPQKRH